MAFTPNTNAGALVKIKGRSPRNGSSATAGRSGSSWIAYITGPQGASTATQAIPTALATPAHDVDLLHDYTRHADFKVEGGYTAMTDLLALPQRPDAVFAANNLMAVGALQAVREAGLEPPGIGVLSFGEVPWAPLVHPGLTTVQVPSYDLGRTAAGLLLDRIAGKEQPLRTVVLRSSLQIRQTTAGPA
jgi:LacI family transcriptional regulator